MPCTTFRAGDGSIGIVCSRGSRGKRCSVEGCGKPAARLCDYPLSGKKTGQTCDRALCEKHATQIGEPVIRLSADPRWESHRLRMASSEDTVDVCPVHARFVQAETAQRTAASEPIVVHVMATAKGRRTVCGIDGPAYGVSRDTAEDPRWGSLGAGHLEGLAVCARCAAKPRVRPAPVPCMRYPLFDDPDFRPPPRKDRP